MAKHDVAEPAWLSATAQADPVRRDEANTNELTVAVIARLDAVTPGRRVTPSSISLSPGFIPLGAGEEWPRPISFCCFTRRARTDPSPRTLLRRGTSHD